MKGDLIKTRFAHTTYKIAVSKYQDSAVYFDYIKPSKYLLNILTLALKSDLAWKIVDIARYKSLTAKTVAPLPNGF